MLFALLVSLMFIKTNEGSIRKQSWFSTKQKSTVGDNHVYIFKFKKRMTSKVSSLMYMFSKVNSKIARLFEHSMSRIVIENF